MSCSGCSALNEVNSSNKKNLLLPKIREYLEYSLIHIIYTLTFYGFLYVRLIHIHDILFNIDAAL